MKTEYDTKPKKKESENPSRMPVVTEKTMGEERMRTKLRYKTTPAQKARRKLGREVM